MQDLGDKPMVITGTGELIGDYMEQYAKLYDIYIDRTSGLLYLPELAPICCYFTGLEIVGKAGPGLLTYSFEFSEDCENTSNSIISERSYHIVSAYDTLYTIALKYGISAETLFELNSSVTDALNLTEGDIIWLE